MVDRASGAVEPDLSGLPKSKGGVPLTPGMKVRTEWRGLDWEAEVVAVRKNTIDIKYTSNASHKAKGHTSRRSRPDKWEVVP